MARNANADVVTEFTEEDLEKPEQEAQLIRYDEAGRAVLIDPFEALAEEVESMDLASMPTIADRLAEAKKPVQVRSDEIMGHDIVWLKWRPQDAMLVNEGTITEGYFVLGRDMTTNKFITIFIGGIALCRTLRQIQQPFRAKLEKRGRTLVFA